MRRRWETSPRLPARQAAIQPPSAGRPKASPAPPPPATRRWRGYSIKDRQVSLFHIYRYIPTFQSTIPTQRSVDIKLVNKNTTDCSGHFLCFYLISIFFISANYFVEIERCYLDFSSDSSTGVSSAFACGPTGASLTASFESEIETSFPPAGS